MPSQVVELNGQTRLSARHGQFVLCHRLPRDIVEPVFWYLGKNKGRWRVLAASADLSIFVKGVDLSLSPALRLGTASSSTYAISSIGPGAGLSHFFWMIFSLFTFLEYESSTYVSSITSDRGGCHVEEPVIHPNSYEIHAAFQEMHEKAG
jgi:hypothetical protein